MTSVAAMSVVQERPVAEHYALAMLVRADFEVAKIRFPAFAEWPEYEDFVSEREALFIGLGTAGAHVQIKPIALPKFERWRRLTGLGEELDDLDHFAAQIVWRRRYPSGVVRAHVAPLDGAAPPPVALGGVQTVHIDLVCFERWRRALARLDLFASDPSYDVFAALTLEVCGSD